MREENVESIYELSPVQRGMLFHSLYAPDSGVYVEQLSARLEGKLEVAVFARAWQQMVDRHAALRSSFHWEELKKPAQVVYRQLEVTLERSSWRGLSTSEQRRRLEAYLHADRERGFDLGAPPLMRLALFELGEGVFQFVWSYHHLYLDGWSQALVLQEVFRCYEALSQGRPVLLPRPRPYRHYIAWLQRQDLEEARSYWQRELAGFTAPTLLGPWQDSPGEHGDYREVRRGFSAPVSFALQSLARRHELTLNTLVQGVWALLLGRYSGDDDVVFGTTTSGRPADLPGVESMVGLFINTLPVRARISPQEALPAWLERLQVQQAELRHYEYSPLDQVQKWSEVPADQGLFDHILVFENYPIDASLRQPAEGLEISDVRSFERTNYALTVVIIPTSELELRALYDCRSWDTVTVLRMLGHFENILRGVTADPSAGSGPRRLGEVPMLAGGERQQLLFEWSDTRCDAAGASSIQELFAVQVERTPEAVAVVCGRECLSYRELDARANALARVLAGLGVGPEVVVALAIDSSPEMLVGLLGVLKAGGAYLPLDPAYPQERLDFMVEDSGAAVVLTEDELAPRFEELSRSGTRRAGGALPGIRVLRLGKGSPESGEPSVGPQEGVPAVGVGPGSLAYVIYTSGSTGRPKGVAITHGTLMNLVSWHLRSYRVRRGDRATQVAGPAFDASVWEIWPYLAVGATLCIPDPETRFSPPELVSWLVAELITVSFLPTPLAELAMAQEWPSASALRALLTGGEALHHRPPAGLGFELVNHYGPTESTVVATCGGVAPAPERTDTPDIGRPIANVRVYLLDRMLRPVPLGAAGELSIGGGSLARGYLDQPGLTAEHFVPDPHSGDPSAGDGGGRLYRTGDLARFRADGAIEFLGRIDRQVKVRGIRIELGEIEAFLAQSPSVRECVVVAQETRPGDVRLVAYLAAEPESAPVERELRGFLKERLPEAMVPSAFVLLEALPLTPNGKVDRAALARRTLPDRAAPQDEFVPPRTPTEVALARIWSRVLGVEQVGMRDNFFELGGDSILSIQVVSGARQEGLVLTPREVFDQPTLGELAAVVATATGGLGDQGPVTGELPLTPIQRWFFEWQLGASHHFNQALMLEVRERLEPAWLERALAVLLEHHDALRLRFSRVGGKKWRQVNERPGTAAPFAQVDLSALEAARQGPALAAAAAAVQGSLDLARGPLVRLVLFDFGSQRTARLHWVIHHLAVDGVSWRILLEDLE
ncbi:MAG: amino acid adenylation domain-containing protein, partial [bacterium]|nr:amino acid adenylation domain-containing protein [bacterium]